MKELVNEMKTNNFLLEKAQNNHRIHDSIASVILEKKKDLEAKHYLFHLFNITYYHTTDFLSGNVESILSEYGPSIISNDTLRKFVTTWKDIARDITENEKIEEKILFDQIFPTISKHIDLSELLPLNNRKDGAFQDYLQNDPFQNRLRELMKQHDFIGTVYAKQFNDRSLKTDLKNTLRKLTKAVAIAEKQLAEN